MIETYDSATGDAFDKSELVTTRKTIAAVQLHQEHYNAWLPNSGAARHHFIARQEYRGGTGNGISETGTTYCLDARKSTIHKIAGDGYCMTNAAAIARSASRELDDGVKLRSLLISDLASGTYEEILQQPGHHHLTTR
ncbi:hypothetical protein [Erwinia sp. V71]|uniref:hypothetical protein n=1 Tax=Erwinia sp. V71 TaxID=3369424 RepID=UPI003F5F6916